MRHPLLLTGFLLLMPAAAHAQVTIDLRALEALPQAPPPPSKPAAHPILRTVPAGPVQSGAVQAGPVPASPVPASRVPAGPAPAGPAATAALPAPPVPPGGTPAPAAAPAAGRQAKASVGPTPPTQKSPTPSPAPSSGSSASPPARPAAPAAPASPAPPSAPLPAAPPPATLPTAPPAVAALAPIPAPVVPAAARPPEPPPVSASAGTTAKPETAGLRLEFKSDQSDLSPAANGAIGELVKATPNGDTVTFNVLAYAAGVADDPSAARRMSLARGLSVRAALIAGGVPSTRIYIRALGASIGDGPPDRVDLTVQGRGGAVPASPPTGAAPSPTTGAAPAAATGPATTRAAKP